MREKIKTAIIGIIGYGIVIGCIVGLIYLVCFHPVWVVGFVNGRY